MLNRWTSAVRRSQRVDQSTLTPRQSRRSLWFEAGRSQAFLVLLLPVSRSSSSVLRQPSPRRRTESHRSHVLANGFANERSRSRADPSTTGWAARCIVADQTPATYGSGSPGCDRELLPDSPPTASCSSAALLETCLNFARRRGRRAGRGRGHNRPTGSTDRLEGSRHRRTGRPGQLGWQDLRTIGDVPGPAGRGACASDPARRRRRSRGLLGQHDAAIARGRPVARPSTPGSPGIPLGRRGAR